MAHTFKIVENPYNTPITFVDFNDTNHGIVAYDPGYGDQDTIIETATVWVRSTNDSGLSQALQTINNAFDLAKYRHDNNSSDPIYIEYSPSGADVGVSELHGGRIIAIEDLNGVSWANLDLKVTIEFTRKNYWQANAWGVATLTSASGAYYIPLTGSVVVYNNSDNSGSTSTHTKRQNYLMVQDYYGNSFPGDLPAIPKITILPDTSQRISGVYVLQYFEDPTTQPDSDYPSGRGWFEGEDASTAAASTGTAYSGGAYQAFAVSTGSTGTNIEWSITDFYSSHYNRLLCGAKFSGTVRIRPYVMVNTKRTYGATVIHTGDDEWRIYDIGFMKVPPVDLEMVNGYYSIRLGINVVCVGGTTFNLDWLQSEPINTSLYAFVDEDYAYNSTGIGGTKYLWIADKNGMYYAYVGRIAASKGISGKTAAKGKIELTPGKKNYLHILWENDSGIHVPQERLNISVEYLTRWRYFNAS